jgi:hypothetical protein
VLHRLRQAHPAFAQAIAGTGEGRDVRHGSAKRVHGAFSRRKTGMIFVLWWFFLCVLCLIAPPVRIPLVLISRWLCTRLDQ